MFSKSGKKQDNAAPPKQNTETDQVISTEAFRQKLSDCPDIIFSEITINANRRQNYTVIFVDGLVDTNLVDDFVLKPLVQEVAFGEAKTEQTLIDLIVTGTAYHCQRRLREKLSDCMSDLFSGSILIIFDAAKAAVTFELQGFEKRGITEPTGENVLKGSKEAFVEVLRVNTALVRRRIQSPDLKIHQLRVGQRTNTTVAIVYLDGVANLQTVEKVKQRISSANIDGIVSAGQIETFLLDHKYTIFPQVLYTERPDKFCGNILEGRVELLLMDYRRHILHLLILILFYKRLRIMR
jgi:spore germination protein KA